MGKLPDLPYAEERTRSVQRRFGGYRHTVADFDGAFYDMENLCSDGFPLTKPRPPRRKYDGIAKNNGVFAVDDRVITVDGTDLCLDSVFIGTVADSPKTFATLGDRVILFPDKLYLNTAAKGRFLNLADLKITITDPAYGDAYAVGSEAPLDLYYWNGSNFIFLEKELGSLEAKVTTRTTFLAESTLYGEKAARNALYGNAVRWDDHFSVGDAVTISGCTKHPENNVTAIIRGIDGGTLMFYEDLFTVETVYRHEVAEPLPEGEYTFTVGGETRGFFTVEPIPKGDILTWNGTSLTAQSGVVLTLSENADGEELSFRPEETDYVESRPVTVQRMIPDMDFLCTCNNRLWGCKGDTVYGSKLGDPFNFNVFDSLSTDSWSVDSGSPGEFTACCTYLGYPLFFKEDHIYKVYGSRPADFSLVDSMTLGVAKDSGKSLAVAGEMLFYLSPWGPVCYSGGVPSSLCEPFGDLRLKDGVGGAMNGKYILSAVDQNGDTHIFVYDTAKNLWHREDDLRAAYFASVCGGLLCATPEGDLWFFEGNKEPPLIWDSRGTAEGEVNWYAEFGPYIMDSPEEKTIHRLKLRLLLGENAEMQTEIAYDGGPWLPLGTIQKGKGMRSVEYPIIPQKCDSFRLRLSGKGDVALQSLSVEYSV